MSASPVTAAAVPSAKRPLEDPSSETGFNDEQPDAKRPALEMREAAEDSAQNGSEVDNEPAQIKVEDTTDGASQVVPGAAGADNPISTTESIKHEEEETQPIQSTTYSNGRSPRQGSFANQHQDESQWLHMRSIISSAEAATVIGKGGENVQLIRRMSGAKCTVSDYARGAVERVLTVSGLVDAVAKVSSQLPSTFATHTNSCMF